MKQKSFVLRHGRTAVERLFTALAQDRFDRAYASLVLPSAGLAIRNRDQVVWCISAGAPVAAHRGVGGGAQMRTGAALSLYASTCMSGQVGFLRGAHL